MSTIEPAGAAGASEAAEAVGARLRADLTRHVVGGAPAPTRIAAPPAKTQTTTDK